MQLKLPKRISPNPLINSTVEIRFASTIEPENALNFYLTLLLDELPRVTDRRIPIIVKSSDPKMKYEANYVFKNDEFVITADYNVIAFGNVDDYKLWDNYFIFIKKILMKLSNAGVVQKIERIGLRYASFLEYKGEDLPIINLEIRFDIPNYARRNELIKTEFFNDRFVLLFQLSRYVKAEFNGEPKDGVLIDIDAVCCTENLPQTLNDEFFKTLEELHLEEKKLFFEILHPDYLASLNPIY